jgi:hypothetical protein
MSTLSYIKLFSNRSINAVTCVLYDTICTSSYTYNCLKQSRWGYDACKDPMARYFQIIDFRVGQQDVSYVTIF